MSEGASPQVQAPLRRDAQDEVGPVLLSHLAIDGCKPRSEREDGAWKDASERPAADLEEAQPSASSGKSRRSSQVRLVACLLGAGSLPCDMWRFLRGMHAQFGGFVPIAVLQYGVQQGLGLGVEQLAERYFLKDVLGLGAHPAMMQSLRAAAKLPWNIKPVMGMLSDAYPLFGFHRTSYLAVAAACGVLAYLSLGLLPLAASATVPLFMLVHFSVATPDVMVDATSAKLSKEVPERASDLQGLLNGALPMGTLAACILSGTLVEAVGPRATFLFVSICPLSILVPCLLGWLPEQRLPREQRRLDLTFLKQHAPVTALAACLSIISVTLSALQVLVQDAAIRGIIVVVCALVIAVSVYLSLRKITPALAKIALFIFARECLQPNLGDPMFVWETSAPDGPRFSPKIMGGLEGVGAVGLFAGVVLYNKYFTRVSYRRTFLLGQMALVAYNLSDYILVMRWNRRVGIPDIVFVAGDDAFGGMIGRFFMMPLFVLCSKVCPDNLEATLFAMLMALGNFGGTVGEFFGATLCDVFGIVDGNFDMLPQAVLAKSICRLLPIPLIFLLVPNWTPMDPIPDAGGKEGGEGGDPEGAGSNSSLSLEEPGQSPGVPQQAVASSLGTCSKPAPQCVAL